MAIALPKIKKKKKFVLAIVAVSLPKMEKKIVLAIVAMTLSKMGKKKCYDICERVKKSCHVHNIFTTFSQ